MAAGKRIDFTLPSGARIKGSVSGIWEELDAIGIQKDAGQSFECVWYRDGYTPVAYKNIALLGAAYVAGSAWQQPDPYTVNDTIIGISYGGAAGGVTVTSAWTTDLTDAVNCSAYLGHLKATSAAMVLGATTGSGKRITMSLRGLDLTTPVALATKSASATTTGFACPVPPVANATKKSMKVLIALCCNNVTDFPDNITIDGMSFTLVKKAFAQIGSSSIHAYISDKFISRAFAGGSINGSIAGQYYGISASLKAESYNPIDTGVTLPSFGSNVPTLSGDSPAGSIKVNSVLTAGAPALTVTTPGDPATITLLWEFDSTARGSKDGDTSYTGLTGDIGKTLRVRAKAVNNATGPNGIFSNYSRAIDVISNVVGTVVNVSSMQELEDTLNNVSGASGKSIRLASGTYGGDAKNGGGVILSGKNYSSDVEITCQDDGHMPVLTGAPNFFFTNCSHFKIRGFICTNPNKRDSGRLQGGVAVGAVGSSAVDLEGCHHFTLQDISSAHMHVGFDIKDLNDAIIEYCTVTECGMDAFRVYQKMINVTMRRNLTHDWFVYEPDISDGDRHPDHIQGASKGDSGGGLNCTFEYNWLECLQGVHNHGIFWGNQFTRPSQSEYDPTKHSKNIITRNNRIITQHTQGVCIEGVDGFQGINDWMTSVNGQKPTYYWLRPKGETASDVSKNVTITGSRTENINGYGTSSVLNYVTNDYVQSTSAPKNWVQLVKDGAGRNVGNRLE